MLGYALTLFGYSTTFLASYVSSESGVVFVSPESGVALSHVVFLDFQNSSFGDNTYTYSFFFHESVDLTRGLGRTAAGGRRAC